MWLDRYEARLKLYGTTQRERDLNRLQQTVAKDLPQSLSCKTVKLNNIDSYLNFTETEKGYDIQSLPNETFSIGDYVIYKTLTYLITKVNGDDEIYTKGSMEQCNHTLLFQSPTGTILFYPCIDTTTSTMGLDESNTITTGNAIHTIKLPFDENTVLIDYNRRFFLDDLSVEEPQVYVVSKPNRTEFKYGNKGLIELTMKQGAYNNQTDRKDLGICDYREPTVTPPTPDPEVLTEIVTITSDAEDNNIKLGLVYTFSAAFTNELGETVTDAIGQYSIDNSYGGLVMLIDNGDDTCTVQINEDAYELSTNEVVLKCEDVLNGFSSSVTLTIVGLF